METFEYKDHADDALSVAALDGDCDGCPTGAAIVGMGSTTVHLDPLSQLALAKWLLANLREHGESTPGLEPPAAPLALGYSLMLNVGDAELSLSDSVSLTGPAMSMLTTAAAEAMQRFREITEPDETDADGVLALAREVLAEQGRRLNECRREHGNMAEWFRDVRNVLFKAGISVPSSETADAVRSLVEEMRRVAAVRAPKLDEIPEHRS